MVFRVKFGIFAGLFRTIMRFTDQVEQVFGHTRSRMNRYGFICKLLRKVGSAKRLQSSRPRDAFLGVRLFAASNGVEIPFEPIQRVHIVDDFTPRLVIVILLVPQKMIPQEQVHRDITTRISNVKIVVTGQYIQNCVSSL